MRGSETFIETLGYISQVRLFVTRIYDLFQRFEALIVFRNNTPCFQNISLSTK